MLGHTLAYVLCCILGHSRDLIFERGETFGTYHWRCYRCSRITQDVVLGAKVPR